MSLQTNFFAIKAGEFANVALTKPLVARMGVHEYSRMEMTSSIVRSRVQWPEGRSTSR